MKKPTAKDIERTQQIIGPVQELWDSGLVNIAGADEAGCGPLAGPVVAACVVMPKEPLVYGVYDSKGIASKKRMRLMDEIRQVALAVGTGMADVGEINELGIRPAVQLAFERSVDDMISQLGHDPDHLFTDSVKLRQFSFPITSMIHADRLIYPVAAASIIAKVTRDQLITQQYAAKYPEYGFEHHKGYGTQEHLRAILQYGALPVHRTQFLRNLKQWREKLTST